jgi:hypothetical protein
MAASFYHRCPVRLVGEVDPLWMRKSIYKGIFM